MARLFIESSEKRKPAGRSKDIASRAIAVYRAYLLLANPTHLADADAEVEDMLRERFGPIEREIYGGQRMAS